MHRERRIVPNGHGQQHQPSPAGGSESLPFLRSERVKVNVVFRDQFTNHMDSLEQPQSSRDERDQICDHAEEGDEDSSRESAYSIPPNPTLRFPIRADMVLLQYASQGQPSETLTIIVHRRFPVLQAGDPLPADTNELPMGRRFLLATDSVAKPVQSFGGNEQDEFTKNISRNVPSRGWRERGPNTLSLPGEDPRVLDDIADDDEEEVLVCTDPEAERAEQQIPEVMVEDPDEVNEEADAQQRYDPRVMERLAHVPQALQNEIAANLQSLDVVAWSFHDLRPPATNTLILISGRDPDIFACASHSTKS